MSKLEELNLNDDEVIEVPEEVPEESTGYIPLVQPGIYMFQLPGDLENVWSTFEATKKGVTRVSAGFSREYPLIVLEDEAKFGGEFRGLPVTAYINNLEYSRRGKDGVEVADMFYLIKALEANLPDEDQSKLSNNRSYINALKRHAGRAFRASVHWEAYCNPKKDIYMTIEDENGTPRAQVQEGTLGCGGSYNSYSRDLTTRIPADETGRFKERFDEMEVPGQECPAHLFSRIKLSRFQPAV